MKGAYLFRLLALLSLLTSGTFSMAQSGDCNANGVADELDLKVRDVALAPESSGATVVFNSSPEITALEFLDVNLDGREDLIVAANGMDVVDGQSVARFRAAVALQDGPAYAAPTVLDIGIPATGLDVVDLDANSFLDVAFADGVQQRVAFNQGDNSFAVAAFAQTGIAASPLPPTDGSSEREGDLNADGLIDLVRATDDGSVEVLLRNEANELVPVFEVSVPAGCGFLSSDSGLVILPLQDLNSDGLPDIAAVMNSACPAAVIGTNRFATLVLLINHGEGDFSQQSRDFSGNVGFRGYRDSNLDGVPDLVFSLLGSSGCNGPVSFCGSAPLTIGAGIVVTHVLPVRTSLDVNGNDLPDECERAVPGDFDGDRRGDITVVRPFNDLFLWITRRSAERSHSQPLQTFFGLPQFDVPYAGDFDGNGRLEPGVVRDAGDVIPGLFGLWWYSLRVDETVETVQWGLKGDEPVVGQFDGDNRADRAVVRNQLGQLVWYIRYADNSEPVVIPWGLAGDRVFAAELTGDGIDDLVVARNFLGGIHWFVRTVDGTFAVSVPWGLDGDLPIPPADLDGDNRADLAIARANGRFLDYYVRFASGAAPQVQSFGLVGDIPLLGFQGGEANAELSVIRPAFGIGQEALHYQRTAEGFVRVNPWGLAGDRFIRPDGAAVP